MQHIQLISATDEDCRGLRQPNVTKIKLENTPSCSLGHATGPQNPQPKRRRSTYGCSNYVHKRRRVSETIEQHTTLRRVHTAVLYCRFAIKSNTQAIENTASHNTIIRGCSFGIALHRCNWYLKQYKTTDDNVRYHWTGSKCPGFKIYMRSNETHFFKTTTIHILFWK